MNKKSSCDKNDASQELFLGDCRNFFTETIDIFNKKVYNILKWEGVDMLKRFEVRNYKKFLEPLVIDFSDVGGYQFNQNCLCGNHIGKMLIYGRNGTGKTNLKSAIIDIDLPLFFDDDEEEDFLNADSELDSAMFSYIFQFGDDEIEYTYEKYSMPLYKSEILKLNGIVIYDFDYATDSYNADNLSLISAETILVQRFLDAKMDVLDGSENSISFLKWIFANAVFANDSPMSEMRSFVGRMMSVSISTLQRQYFIRTRDTFFDKLEGENLQKLEAFLNDMGVECRLESKRLPDGKNELYFKHKKLIPFFENASSGTMVLFNLYRRIVTTMPKASFCFFDEFDAFFHYEISERFLNYCKQNFPNCQIIFTTHNTNLMTNEIMRPDCIFILSQRGTLTPLNKATPRELREGHNLEKMYISGEFEKYE